MKRLLILVLVLVLACSSQEVVEEDLSQFNDIGVHLSKQGDYDGAAEQFLIALERDMTYETARNNLALTYVKAQKFNESIEQFVILSGFSPNNPSYHYDLAISLAENCRVFDDCDLDRAISEFELAEKLSPGYLMATENVDVLKKVKEELENDS